VTDTKDFLYVKSLKIQKYRKRYIRLLPFFNFIHVITPESSPTKNGKFNPKNEKY